MRAATPPSTFPLHCCKTSCPLAAVLASHIAGSATACTRVPAGYISATSGTAPSKCADGTWSPVRAVRQPESPTADSAVIHVTIALLLPVQLSE